MGATNFRDLGNNPEIATAYRELRQNAEAEFGHQQGYNGTISTTNGYVIIQSTPVDLKKACEIEDAEWAKEDEGTARFSKWGKCCAVRVIDVAKKIDGWLFFGLGAS